MAEQFQYQHQHRTPNIGEQLRDGIVKPVMSIIIAQGTQLVMSKAVDGLFHDSIGPKKEALSEGYRDVDKIKPGGYENKWDVGGSDKSDKNSKNNNDDLQEQPPVMQIDDELKTAIEHLERAKENNTCAVCKPKIEEAKRYVEDKTKEIIKAGEINKEMERLQLTGEIAQKPWKELSEEEKNFIRERI